MGRIWENINDNNNLEKYVMNKARGYNSHTRQFKYRPKRRWCIFSTTTLVIRNTVQRYVDISTTLLVSFFHLFLQFTTRLFLGVWIAAYYLCALGKIIYSWTPVQSSSRVAIAVKPFATHWWSIRQREQNIRPSFDGVVTTSQNTQVMSYPIIATNSSARTKSSTIVHYSQQW